MVTSLVHALPAWGQDVGASGHASPAYLPNMLAFLADLGVQAGDDTRVDEALDHLCAHQYEDGRFTAFGRAPGHPEPLWGSLPCDTHIITDVLIRYRGVVGGCGVPWSFARLPDTARPRGLEQAADTLLEVWRSRGEHQPYRFGHGVRFKTVKWPPLWYGAYGVLDTRERDRSDGRLVRGAGPAGWPFRPPSGPEPR